MKLRKVKTIHYNKGQKKKINKKIVFFCLIYFKFT